jgi:hypothetical protein
VKKVLFVIACLFYLGNLFAAGLAVQGKYRARGTSIRNLHLNSNAGNKYRNYMDHRFRFNAAFVANDLIVVKSDIDFFGNCSGYAGSSFGCIYGETFEAPSIAQASHPSNNALFNRWVRDDYSAGTFTAKRLWAEINTKFGLLQVGRQPDNWGAGIYASDGEGLWDNYGDTLDRIAFDMKFGSVLFSPYYGNYNDTNIESTNDIYEMGFKIKYHMVDTKNIYGLYVALRGSRDTEQRLQTYDLYATHSFGPVNLLLELVFQNGSIAGAGIDANGILARFDGDVASWLNTSIEFGSATGEDDDNQDYTGYSFNPDFKPALILFAQEFGQHPFRSSATRGATTFSYPSSVNDAWYLKPKLGFKYGASSYDLSLIWAQKRSTSKSLGYECDFTYKYKSSENLFYAVDLGVLMPGEEFEDTGVELTYAVIGGLRVGILF